MKKKLAALVLAATMIMGAGLNVCASGTISDMAGAGTGQEITGTGEMNLPTIKVIVPTTVDFVINPFQMEYATDPDDPSTKSSSQIICAPQEIANASDVAIAVNVSELTAKAVPEGVLISTTALTSKTTTKSAFLYLEVKKDGEEFKTSYGTTNTNQVVVPYVKEGDTKTKKGAKDALVVLAAGTDDAPQKAQFVLGGSVVANPTVINSDKTVSAAPWTDADKFNVSFKFTFTPQVVTASSGS